MEMDDLGQAATAMAVEPSSHFARDHVTVNPVDPVRRARAHIDSRPEEPDNGEEQCDSCVDEGELQRLHDVKASRRRLSQVASQYRADVEQWRCEAIKLRGKLEAAQVEGSMFRPELYEDV